MKIALFMQSGAMGRDPMKTDERAYAVTSNLGVGSSNLSERAISARFRPVSPSRATFPAPQRFPWGLSKGPTMASWHNEPRIDPVVWATALLGVVTAAILVTAF